MSNYQIVTNKESDFSALWARMDKDKDLAYLKGYTLVDSEGKTINKAVSMTSNRPAVEVNVISSILMGSEIQHIVEGKNINSTQKRIVEGFINDNLKQADERLVRNGRSELMPFLCNHICIRGWIGVRWLSRMEGERYIPDLLYLDMRYVPFERGVDGFNWVAPKFNKSKAQIKNEYNQDVSGECVVCEFWDDTRREIYLDGQLFKTEPHNLGRPPFVIMAAPAGFMLMDKGYMEYEGESLLFMNRDLYPEENRMLSIEQTLNMKRVMPPLQKEVATLSGPKSEYPDGIGKGVEVLPGEEWKAIPQSDLSNASQMARLDITNDLQRGGVNEIDLGNVQQSVAALWITEQMEIRSRIMNPRANPIEVFYPQLARLMIEQYQKKGYKTDIGISGWKQTYSAEQLGNPEEYSIESKFMTSNRQQEIANIAMAQGAKGVFSTITILKDILQCEDPEGELARLDAEKAEAADPALFFFRKACSLADEAELLTGPAADQKRLESMMLTNKGVALIKQAYQPQPKAEEPKGEIETPKPSIAASPGLLAAAGGSRKSPMALAGTVPLLEAKE